MSYTKTTWVNNQAPAINADNLNHMEQGIESAHNQIDINTSDIDSLETQVQTNTQNIASEASARQTTDTSLQLQIDQLVAPTGEAPNPSEIENARIGDDNVIYDSLGNAIRGQFSNVKSALSNFSAFFEGKGNTYASGVYIDLEVGHSYRVYVDSWDVTGVTVGSGFDKFVLGYNSNGTDNTIYSRKMPDTIGAFYDIDIPTSAINPKLFVGGRVTSGKFGVLHIEDRTALLETADLKSEINKNISRVKTLTTDWNYISSGNFFETKNNVPDAGLPLYIEFDDSKFKVYVRGYQNGTKIWDRNAWEIKSPLILPSGVEYQLSYGLQQAGTLNLSDLSLLYAGYIVDSKFCRNLLSPDMFIIGTFNTASLSPEIGYSYRVASNGLIWMEEDSRLFVDAGFLVYVAIYDKNKEYVSGISWTSGSGIPLSGGYNYAFSIKRDPEDTSHTMIWGSDDFIEMASSVKMITLWKKEDLLTYYDGRFVEEAIEKQFDSIVKGINHRGFNKQAPENTLPAFRLSAKHGFKYVETDISFTSDGVAVCLHDETIDRTSDGTGNISQLTYAQVSEYDFGSWFSLEYTGTKIPTLEEFLLLCRALSLHPYLEIKSVVPYTQAQIESIVDMVAACGMKGNVTYISFVPTYLTYVKEHDSKARLGLVCNTVDATVISNAESLMLDTNEVFIDTGTFGADQVALCKSAKIPMEIWTVNLYYTCRSSDPYITGITSDFINAGKYLREFNI